MKTENLVQEGDINLSKERKEWIHGLPDDAIEILQTDASFFLHQALSTPCLDVITDCSGPYIINSQGKKILDFHGNNVHQVGYKNSFVLEAIVRQLYALPFSPRRYTNHKAIELAKYLADVSPGDLDRVLLAPSGSIANSMALKLARIKTGKHKVISMWGSFHGAGMDTISVGGETAFRSGIGPLMPGTSHVPPPVTYRGLWENDPEQNNYVEYIKYVLEQEGDVGALIAETIRNTDVQVPHTHFWKKIRSLCDQYGVLLILDEIPIALGRTGKFFAFEHYGIVPDMVTIGKGLGGGVFPIAAVIARKDLNVAKEHSIGHFTHEKSPVGSAAALATLRYIADHHILQYVTDLESFVREQLNELFLRYPMIGDVRGKGLLWGIELVKNRETKVKASAEAEKIMYFCLEQGLNFKVSQGNVLTLSPALVITKQQLSDAFSILDNAFSKFLNSNS
jgi:4-aminobutyrate aminotransferase